jgi:UDP-2,3-diacylglucosamine pyrophosphatase LpxH
MSKRQLDIAVISDLHLGNSACHANELLKYLKSIRPKTLILNGDVIDLEESANKHLPESHQAIISQIIRMATTYSKVYYLSGNHDKTEAQENPLQGSPVIFRKHLELVIDQKKYWIFHGDIFDASVTISPLIAKLGLLGYRNLIGFTRLQNRVRAYLGLSRLSLASLVKKRWSKALRYVADFEQLVCKHALKKDFDVVICGHIHVPVIKTDLDNKFVYMNAGDWVENLTALEYQNRLWKIHVYDEADYIPISKRLVVPKIKEKRPAKSVTPDPTNPTPVRSIDSHSHS